MFLPPVQLSSILTRHKLCSLFTFVSFIGLATTSCSMLTSTPLGSRNIFEYRGYSYALCSTVHNKWASCCTVWLQLKPLSKVPRPFYFNGELSFVSTLPTWATVLWSTEVLIILSGLLKLPVPIHISDTILSETIRQSISNSYFSFLSPFVLSVCDQFLSVDFTSIWSGSFVKPLHAADIL